MAGKMQIKLSDHKGFTGITISLLSLKNLKGVVVHSYNILNLFSECRLKNKNNNLIFQFLRAAVM